MFIKFEAFCEWLTLDLGIRVMGQNKLNFKKVGMIFDLAKNFTNYFWDLLPSFGDNVKSAGPP
jgi:hypothetical protein